MGVANGRCGDVYGGPSSGHTSFQTIYTRFSPHRFSAWHRKNVTLTPSPALSPATRALHVRCLAHRGTQCSHSFFSSVADFIDQIHNNMYPPSRPRLWNFGLLTPYPRSKLAHPCNNPFGEIGPVRSYATILRHQKAIHFVMPHGDILLVTSNAHTVAVKVFSKTHKKLCHLIQLNAPSSTFYF